MWVYIIPHGAGSVWPGTASYQSSCMCLNHRNQAGVWHDLNSITMNIQRRLPTHTSTSRRLPLPLSSLPPSESCFHFFSLQRGRLNKTHVWEEFGGLWKTSAVLFCSFEVNYSWNYRKHRSPAVKCFSRNTFRRRCLKQTKIKLWNKQEHKLTLLVYIHPFLHLPQKCNNNNLNLTSINDILWPDLKNSDFSLSILSIHTLSLEVLYFFDSTRLKHALQINLPWLASVKPLCVWKTGFLIAGWVSVWKQDKRGDFCHFIYLTWHECTLARRVLWPWLIIILTKAVYGVRQNKHFNMSHCR